MNTTTKNKKWQPSKYYQIPVKVFDDPKLRDIDKRIYCLIFNYHNSSKGSCFATNDYLAEAFAISPETVQKSLQRLEKGKHIKREYHNKKGYRILIPLRGDGKVTGNSNKPTSPDEEVAVPQEKEVEVPVGKTQENFECDEIIKHFEIAEVSPNVDALYKRKAEREAAKSLCKKPGFEETKKAIETLKQYNANQYTKPKIKTPKQLLENFAILIAFWEREGTPQGRGIIKTY